MPKIVWPSMSFGPVNLFSVPPAYVRESISTQEVRLAAHLAVGRPHAAAAALGARSARGEDLGTPEALRGNWRS